MAFEIRVENRFVGPVDVGLGETRESGLEILVAELIDLLDRPGGLIQELAAGKIQNLEAFAVVFLLKAFEDGVLRGENAIGGGVDDEKHLAFVLVEDDFLACRVFDGDLVKAHK
jgi:hypothetical protein